MTYDAIRQRLATKGITLCKQRVSAILQNPFYCGLLSHRMLQGEVVKGNHEPLVSQELFLKVNGLLQGNHHGYTIKEENEQLPLKCFLKCEKSGQHLHGYIVKRKGIHYYKCSTKGCNNNRNAQLLNQRFAEMLEAFQLDASSDAIHLIKQQTVATFNRLTEGLQEERIAVENKLAALESKINRLEERFIEEDLSAELYQKYLTKYKEEKAVLEEETQGATLHVSNLIDCVETAVDLAVNLPKKWLLANFSIKQRLQKLLFPESIWYDRLADNSRTTRINSVFLYFAHLKQIMNKQKEQNSILNIKLCFSVAGAGQISNFLSDLNALQNKYLR